MTPIYNSTTGQIKRPRRRLIGETPKHIREYLKSLTPHENALLRITVDMRKFKN